MNLPIIFTKLKKTIWGSFMLMAIALPLNIMQISAWPMLMHDNQHTSQSQHSIYWRPQPDWTLPLALSLTSTPVIGNQGNIYLGSTDNNLYAIDRRGNNIWAYPTNGPITSSPAVDLVGNIYIGSADQSFYAVQNDGQLLWSYNVNSAINSSPTIVSRLLPTTIYTASQNGQVHAFYSTGSHLWSSAPLQYGIDQSSPAITSNNNIAISTLGNAFAWSSGQLNILNQNGSSHCSYDTGFYQGDGSRSSVSIMPNDNILLATKDSLGWGPGRLFIIDQNCNEVCHTTDLNHHYSSPAIADDGTIYLGTGNGLSAINQSCQVQWTAPTGSISYSTPAISANNKILAGADNGNFYIINPDGSVRWQYDLGEQLGSPIIGSGGKIYINSANNLYAFKSDLLREVFTW
ncbi:MAG: PQQ-binding-like beta-propeller repeat protein [bacterium]|nr:PQQ-binding-like beta-propeller repeat protein [bacterium]